MKSITDADWVTALLILRNAVRYQRMAAVSKPVPLDAADIATLAILEDAAKRVLKGDA